MPNGLKMFDLGEKAFLTALLPTLSADPRFLNGFGHDASVMDIGFPELDLVLKIDRAAKPIAALNGWSDFRVWGRLAVTANCSDILAVGGTPKGFMLSISMGADTLVETANAIVAGAAEECQRHEVAFLGGDTKEALGLNVVGAAVGTISKGRHFDRHAGKVGDLLVLAGTVGGFLGAYWMCQGGGVLPVHALEYLSRPKAAWPEAAAVARVGGVRSACDLSDGLGSSALNVIGEGLGAVLDFDALPFHSLARESAATRGVDLLPYAFGVGDWGILYAVDPSEERTIQGLGNHGLAIAIIGRIGSEPGLRLRRGSVWTLTTSENEHFRHRMEDQGHYLEDQERSVFLAPIVS